MTPSQLYFRNMHAEFCIFTCKTMLVTRSKLPVFTFHFVSNSVCYGSRTELQQRWFFWDPFCLLDCAGVGGHWLDLFGLELLHMFFCLNSVGLQMLHENGQTLFCYFRIQFSVSWLIRTVCLHTSFLETKSLEVEGEIRCCIISMLTLFFFSN